MHNHPSAALRSIAVGLPKTVRTNDWFRDHYPTEYATFASRSLAKIFDTKQAARTDGSIRFDRAMTKFLDDPFRGTQQRRVITEGQSQIELEAAAARAALTAANLTVHDVDAILVSAFPSEQPGIGDGVYLAKALGTNIAAFNVESACSGGLAALQMASGLVSSGQAKNVLVVVSCIYSRCSDFSDTLSWFLGDGVGAYVVSQAKGDERFVSFDARHTAESCGAFEYRLEVHDGLPRTVIRANADAGRALRDMTPEAIRSVCAGALAKAGMTTKDIDFFIPNTPLAWFSEMFCDILEVPRDRTVSTYAELANMGPALNPINLHRALSRGLVSRGDRVLLFSIGSVSSAAACVLELGDVAVGEAVQM